MTRRRLLISAVGVAACILILVRVRDLMMLGYVDSAIVRVRAVTAAESQFTKTHPEVGYTCTLSQLPHDEQIARLIVKDGKDNGYVFDIIGCQLSESKKPKSMYHVTARPLHSGLPAFCSDQSGIIRSDEGGSIEKCLTNGVPF